MVDKDLCYGCHTCEVACKQEHNLPAGIGFIKVSQEGPRRIGRRLQTDYIPVICTHCEKPPCVPACPVHAIQQHPCGAVLIDSNICNSCRKCIEAFPFGAIQFYEEKNIAVKCDLCISRINEGLLPACVHHCPTNALLFETPSTASLERGKSKMIFSYRLSKNVFSGYY